MEDRMAPTVVSAYIPIPSKQSPEIYIKWIAQFWPTSTCQLVWYTAPALVPIFQKLFEEKLKRGTVIIETIDINALTALKKFDPLIWYQALEKDPERGSTNHTPELYALWYEKKEFVRRAMERNPFGSETFVWCDAGICRNTNWVPALHLFPLEHHIPRGKMLVLQIENFTPEEYRADPVTKLCPAIDLGRLNRIGGGILASDRVGWERWSAAYDSMLQRYVLAGRFIGKDQNLMASMILEDPTMAVCLSPPVGLNPIDQWFYLLLFLSAIGVQ